MHRKSVAAIFLCLFGLISAVHPAFAQSPLQSTDTLKLTVKQVEDRFLRNNLQLIIQHYNISNAEAQVITARLFQNPELNFSNVLYNPITKKILDVSSKTGEYAFSLNQLFLTAGKRNKNIQLANLGVQQAKYQFFDLLRTLKLTLRNDFFTIYFQQQSARVYDEEISSLSNILKAYKLQYTKGNISEKEVLRIQSQLYSLQSELTNLTVGIDTTENQLKVLLRANSNAYIVPQYNYQLNGKEVLLTVPYQNLLDSAYTNRNDFKLAKSALEYNNVNLSLQRALAVPDLNIGVTYDKQASYIRDYTGVGINFALPFFNRNQGGIKQAKIAIDQSKVQLQSEQFQIESDVATNYKIALKYETVYNSFDPQFKGDFTHLIHEVFLNYAKRNISLLEFLDFYDSYKVNTVQLNTVQLNRITSLEQLNFVTGTPFFNQ